MDEPRRIAQETALGYELDTITLREIAAVRYVRHHEWLHHVVGTAIPTERILAPKIEPTMKEAELDQRLAKLKEELAELKKGEETNWSQKDVDDRSQLLNQEIINLRDNTDSSAAEESVQKVEAALGKIIVSEGRLNSVPITYDRGNDAMEDI